MKIVRHIAPDMRQALRSIRAQLGEDAVILSSRRVPEGVEVTAAVDFDASSLEDVMSAPAARLTPPPAPNAPVAAARQTAPPARQSTTQVAPSPAQVAYTAPPAHAAAPAYSHAAASHYFPASQRANARPFAHILASDAVPSDIPALAPAPVATQPTVPVQPMHAAVATTSRREPTINVVTSEKPDVAAEALAELPPPPAPGVTNDAMGSELKTLRRMLETQLAQLAWNDLTRRAPVHIEILRELTEIGITQDLSDYILKQLPEKVELGFARRFAIAGLSQYLLVTGDRWLENGGRVAFIGATGVGKTTTLAKLAVRWVLRHGTRDLALVGCDTVRIGAQDQIQSLGQLLGVPVYTPENFESLPTLLSRLGDRHRLILIDTPGSSLRDAQLGARLGVLSTCASQMETALVLGASTQAGAIEETLKRYVPANPACCVLTKLDEAASLGGALSALIRARLPVSYVSEGQRVPEDLRPARSLELVSTAVRLAKASGAVADEDLLRRRFGKTANAIT
ncbi:MAG TPA: flagellar biosynthesis protein FlhF [Steroidobacteraceae bacterium]